MTHLTDDPLRAALEPFATLADRYDPPEGDDAAACWYPDAPTLGDLRRARAALAAAPQPAPAPAGERAAMIEVIVQADDAYDRVQGGSWAGVIADALLAAAWTRGGDAAGQLAALTAAVNAERDALIKYDRTPSDRGGSAGPKGRAYSRWLNCRADVVAALARPSAQGTEGEPHAEDKTVPGGLRSGVDCDSGVVGSRSDLIAQARALLAINATGSAVPKVPNLAVIIIERLVAALARPSAPETQQGLTREQVGHMLDAKRKAEALDELAALGQQCDKAAPETLAWAVDGGKNESL